MEKLLRTKKEVVKHLSESKEIVAFPITILKPVLKMWDDNYAGRLNFFAFGQTVHMRRETKCRDISTSAACR